MRYQAQAQAMLLIFSKIFSTFVTVILLAHIAKRLSPRFAGVLGGFPLGSGLLYTSLLGSMVNNLPLKAL